MTDLRRGPVGIIRPSRSGDCRRRQRHAILSVVLVEESDSIKRRLPITTTHGVGHRGPAVPLGERPGATRSAFGSRLRGQVAQDRKILGCLVAGHTYGQTAAGAAAGREDGQHACVYGVG
jgi:hypothetical protein